MQIDKRTIALTLALLLMLTLLGWLGSHAFLKSQGAFMHGANDFEIYYSAASVFREGKNPYEAEVIRDFRMNHQLSERNLFFLYPPVVIFPFLPLTFFDFYLSALLWFSLNLIFAFFSGILIWSAQSPGQISRRSLFLISASLLSAPIVITLQCGQLSLLLTFFLAAALWALTRKHDLLAGFLFSLLLTKHVLFYPFFLFLVFFVIGNKRYQVFWGGCLSVLSFAVFFFLFYPQLIQGYLSVLPEAADIALRSRNSTLGDFLQEIIFNQSGSVSRWPLGVVFILGLLISAVLSYRGASAKNWRPWIAPLLCLSLVSAPYGWVFDQSVLFIGQVLTFARASAINITPRTRQLIYALFFGLQLFSFVLGKALSLSLGDWAWFPLMMALVLLISEKILQAEEKTA